MLNALQLFANRRQRYDKTLFERILSFEYSRIFTISFYSYILVFLSFSGLVPEPPSKMAQA